MNSATNFATFRTIPADRRSASRIPAVTLATAVLALYATPSVADVEDRIQRCAASASREARITCLEDALRELSGDSTPPKPQQSQPPVAAGLGAEQVEDREPSADEAARVRAAVVDFRFVGYRRLMVRLENGQVWRQLDGDRTSVERGLRDAESFEVEMWATRLGGYRMRILPLGRTIRVERLQ